MNGSKIIALVGNPNSGKSTLLNALTGTAQRIGNWPGVTVERKSGFLTDKGVSASDCKRGELNRIELVDLPGIYSLSTLENSSVDENIARDFLCSEEVDVFVQVIDCGSLERALYLTSQLFDMQKPLIIALNKMDMAKRCGFSVDVDALKKRLGCPVVPLVGCRGEGMDALRECLFAMLKQPAVSAVCVSWPPVIQQLLDDMLAEPVHSSETLSRFKALDLMENGKSFSETSRATLEKDGASHSFAPYTLKEQSRAVDESRETDLELEDADILIAGARYDFAHDVVEQVVSELKGDAQKSIFVSLTERIDRIVLNRFLGVPIFLAVMYGLFLFSVSVGGVFQDFFDIGSDALFVQGVAHVLLGWHAPVWLTQLLADGVGRGLNTMLTFVPVLGAMFLALSFLEASGYMTRAAFVVDRLMRALGLPGQSFVPMIMGLGCNVPAVMAARTLGNERDRILTVLMSPFISCGARLAIYSVFAAAFFPQGGQNIVFALYLVGVLAAVFTGFLLRKTLLAGSPSPFVMEMPAYHWPRFRFLLLQSGRRLALFLKRAGKMIIPLCVVLGLLNSHLSSIARVITPVFAPMGLHPNNWPATVGLFTGFLAKEMVVGTLNKLYAPLAHVAHSVAVSPFSFLATMKMAVLSVVEHIKALPQALLHPLLFATPLQTVNRGVYGVMYQYFDGQRGAFAYLLFTLLYVPCVSTVAVIARELNRGWATFSVLWSLFLAYGVAVLFYQLSSGLEHLSSALSWVGVVGVVFSLTIFVMRYRAKMREVSLI